MRIPLLALVIGLAGCARVSPGASEAAPTPLTVSRPVERDVTDYADFTGRTAAVDSVEGRAHVWGYLDQVNFKEGALVEKGNVLFEIDRKTYQAVYEANKAQVAQNEAGLQLAKVPYERFTIPSNDLSVS